MDPAAMTDLATRDDSRAERIEEMLGRICGEVTWVDITLLRDSLSPRLGGIDGAHVRHLAELADELPPLVVHRATMHVVDGSHRLAAARGRGQRQVPVVYFEGTSDEAFIVAVRLNAVHGKTLFVRDRTAAARRILSTHPHCSDRWIAAMCGVAPRTVATLRRGSADDRQRLNIRIGRDGRRRPLSAWEGRRTAEQIMRDEPKASLREVARRAGISVGTALDVRRRLLAGLSEEDRQAGGEAQLVPRQSAVGDAGRPTARKLREHLEWLTREPALRYTDYGRALLRLVSATLGFLDRSGPSVDVLPSHCQSSLEAVARACAASWLEFAERLGDKESPTRTANRIAAVESRGAASQSISFR